MWLIVRQLPIKARWWDGPLTFRNFSQSNKHDCSCLVAVKIELTVSQKAGCWTIVCNRLLTLMFPSAAMFINIYNVLKLFEQSFPRDCYWETTLRKWHKNISLPSLIINLHILFIYLLLKSFLYNCKLQI